MPENVEIERRFLVDGRFHRPWVDSSHQCIEIQQWYLNKTGLEVSIDQGTVGYEGNLLVSNVSEQICRQLSEQPEWTIRIRKSHSAYLLTLKGSRKGAAAAEFEWGIEQKKAQSIIQRSTFPYVEKKRYLWRNTDGFEWEIDEFEGNLAGLIIAEVELEEEETEVQIPTWTGMELTYLRGWSNASLARMLTRQ